jgi:hypothetical protein
MRYQIASEEYEWRQMFNKAKGDLSAPELIQSLDLHYHAKRLEVLNSILLQQKVMDAKSLKDFWPVTRANDVVKQLDAKYPMFTILKKINSLLLMSEPDEKETKELIDLIMEHEIRIR